MRIVPNRYNQYSYKRHSACSVTGYLLHVTRYNTIPCHVIPYHAIPYNTVHNVQYHTVPYNTIQYNTVKKPQHTVSYRIIPYHTIPHRNVQYRTVPYNTISYRTIPYLTVQYRIIPYRTVNYTMSSSSVLYFTVMHCAVLNITMTPLCFCIFQILPVFTISIRILTEYTEAETDNGIILYQVYSLLFNSRMHAQAKDKTFVASNYLQLFRFSGYSDRSLECSVNAKLMVKLAPH